MDPVVVIPAFEPSDALLEIVGGLRARGRMPIVVVNDGSGPGFVEIFAAASKHSDVTVLAHAENRGKGCALRTGMEHVLALHPGCAGMVTADADGQHAVGDIIAVAAALALARDALVLGARRFTRDVPFANRLGNACTRTAIRLMSRRGLADTQTGLRGIPRAWLPDLLQLRGERYEFEMEMLLWACARAVPVHEVEVRTIYDGAPSHFAGLADSARIAAALARFAVRGRSRACR
jgi:glycosyltransferase involved in cell wall biosynthesis